MDVIQPILNSALSWAVVGTLGWTVVQLAKITKAYGLSQKGLKALLRRDLINRWHDVRDDPEHKLTTADKDEWLNDYAVYSELNGKNGYLDDAHNKILNIVSCD